MLLDNRTSIFIQINLTQIFLGAAFLHMKVIIGVNTVEQKSFERSSKVGKYILKVNYN